MLFGGKVFFDKMSGFSDTGSADMYEMVICSDYLEPYSVGKLASV